MVDARSEPEYEPRAHTTTRRLMVTLAARRFSKVRPYSYADARLETRHAQLVPDLPLRLYGAWLTRGPGQNFNPPAPGTPSVMLLAAARAMGRLRIVRNLPNIGSLIRLRVVWRLFLANTSSDTGAFRYEAGTGHRWPWRLHPRDLDRHHKGA